MVWRLFDHVVEEEHQATEDKIPDSAARGVRLSMGSALLVAICHRIYVAEQDIAQSYAGDASADQIVQLWMPHIFYMLAIVGTSIAFNIIARPNF